VPQGDAVIIRWLKFNAVGAIGIVVQLAALAMLTGLVHVQYLIATALAVETAVLHNFAWHERWTWRERAGARGTLGRLARFNLSTGALSILSNLVLMRLLVGRFHLQPVVGNMISIAATSLANFLVSELFVFRKPGKGDGRVPKSLRGPRGAPGKAAERVRSATARAAAGASVDGGAHPDGSMPLPRIIGQ
jgi:putative flippase GtrA